MRAAEQWKKRATSAGLIAGAASAMLWPIHAVVQSGVRPLFLASLGVMAICGLVLVLLAASDLALVSRGHNVRPARLFDLLLGLALMVPSVGALSSLF